MQDNARIDDLFQAALNAQAAFDLAAEQHHDASAKAKRAEQELSAVYRRMYDALNAYDKLAAKLRDHGQGVPDLIRHEVMAKCMRRGREQGAIEVALMNCAPPEQRAASSH